MITTVRDNSVQDINVAIISIKKEIENINNAIEDIKRTVYGEQNKQRTSRNTN